MSVSQISVFLESQPGHLKRILDTFDEAEVNVRGYSASDTGDYGIVRFILDKPQKGLEVLEATGGAVACTEVLCIKLIDKPGELARVMGIISDADLNITYSYSLISTYIALNVSDIETAEALLSTKPVELVCQKDLAQNISGDCSYE